MSDLLAIIDEHDTDDHVLAEIARLCPTHVTVLLELNEDTAWAVDESERGRALRDRLAGLLASVERLTGSVVEGLAGTRAQIRGLRFDAIVDERPLLVA